MTHSQALRPAWTPLTIALMVLGFVVFWPLGLAMLAYIIWGDRLPEFRRNAEGVRDDFKRSFRGCGWGGSRDQRWNAYQSGNSAFDDYRAAELKRIEEERRRLDEERAEFETFVQNLRRARDQEEFDRFKADRRRQRDVKPTAQSDDGVIDL
ncbi:DUF2852 domain-containing protein [Kaistia dalseonensis]|uniref:DUF2852 domain-containing protein n=1 Tax=Kaistia dalseonensis TaxID=410840 RepID=A0ABU0H7B3_9HYPH|nr:DUF2852 domain-containing protein [Kaistia dalseonensis]MCX5495098.1 DUF2852 domain-containing protein [Kaistia dalseonensis]MDQ0437680.1 hypothetical protein [Kaistia dalseonensis]